MFVVGVRGGLEERAADAQAPDGETEGDVAVVLGNERDEPVLGRERRVSPQEEDERQRSEHGGQAESCYGHCSVSPMANGASLGPAPGQGTGSGPGLEPHVARTRPPVGSPWCP